jgi:hypothetical protein
MQTLYNEIQTLFPIRTEKILALFAMEQPVSLDAEDIRNEKVKVGCLGGVGVWGGDVWFGKACVVVGWRFGIWVLDPRGPAFQPPQFKSLQSSRPSSPQTPPQTQVLRSMKVVGPEDVVVGQYRWGGGRYRRLLGREWGAVLRGVVDGKGAGNEPRLGGARPRPQCAGFTAV